MPLAHLIPHLDAEISRLERARALLASLSISTNANQAAKVKQAAGDKLSASRLIDLAPIRPPLENTTAATMASRANVSEPAVRRARAPRLFARQILEPDRRSEPRKQASRIDRRRRTFTIDTALRGAVPSGPIVVSAEEVRRSQESKTAQASRSADLKRAGEAPASHVGWSSPGKDSRSLDALLQRLMKIGEEDAERANANHLPLVNQG